MCRKHFSETFTITKCTDGFNKKKTFYKLISGYLPFAFLANLPRSTLLRFKDKFRLKKVINMQKISKVKIVSGGKRWKPCVKRTGRCFRVALD